MPPWSCTAAWLSLKAQAAFFPNLLLIGPTPPLPCQRQQVGIWCSRWGLLWAAAPASQVLQWLNVWIAPPHGAIKTANPALPRNGCQLLCSKSHLNSDCRVTWLHGLICSVVSTLYCFIYRERSFQTESQKDAESLAVSGLQSRCSGMPPLCEGPSCSWGTRCPDDMGRLLEAEDGATAGLTAGFCYVQAPSTTSSSGHPESTGAKKKKKGWRDMLPCLPLGQCPRASFPILEAHLCFTGQSHADTGVLWWRKLREP